MAHVNPADAILRGAAEDRYVVFPCDAAEAVRWGHVLRDLVDAGSVRRQPWSTPTLWEELLTGGGANRAIGIAPTR